MAGKEKTRYFVSELMALLKKYDYDISLTSDDCSDWYGITGEAMAIHDNKTNEDVVLADGETYLSSSNLKEWLKENS